ESAAKLLERGAFLAQAAVADDAPLARAELAERLAEPARTHGAVMQADHNFLGAWPAVGEEILPIILAAAAERRVQGLVGGAQAHVHALYLGDVDLERHGDLVPAGVGERRARHLVDARAQPAQVEE